MKKLVSLLLVIFLAACAVAATPATPPGPPPPSLAPPDDFPDKPFDTAAPTPAVDDGTRLVKWLIPVLLNDKDFQKACTRIQGVTDRINVLLRPHELSLRIDLRNTTVNPVVSPDGIIGDYAYAVTDDILGILVSGEDYDLISLPTAHVPVHLLADQGLLRNITGDVLGYEKLRNALDEAQIDALRYAGGIWGVPAGFDIQENIARSYLAVNDVPFDTLNIPRRETLADLLYASKQTQGSALPYTMFIDPQPHAYRREYPQFPFKVSEDLLFVFTADGGVEAYPGSQIARQDLELAKKIREANRDEAPFDRGSHLVYYNPKKAMNFEFVSPMSDVKEDAEGYAPMLLAPEKPRVLYGNPYGKVMNVVPAHAAAYGLVLLDVIYGDGELYQAFGDEAHLFGLSDGVYILENMSPASRFFNGAILDIDGSMNPGYGNGYYYFNLFDCVRQGALEPKPDTALYAPALSDTSYAPMPWDGFTFDFRSVEGTYTTVCQRVWGIVDEPGTAGGYFRDKSLAFIFDAMHTDVELAQIASTAYDFGLDIVLEECRRQYAEFLQNKGWSAPAPSN